MGGKGGRSGTGKDRAPRWASAVPGEDPLIMWSPHDIPEGSQGMLEQEAVQLFPKTTDTPQGMEDWAQDSDEYRRREGDRRTDGIGMICG